jgi:hypothetical protein
MTRTGHGYKLNHFECPGCGFEQTVSWADHGRMDYVDIFVPGMVSLEEARQIVATLSSLYGVKPPYVGSRPHLRGREGTYSHSLQTIMLKEYEDGVRVHTVLHEFAHYLRETLRSRMLSTLTPEERRRKRQRKKSHDARWKKIMLELISWWRNCGHGTT